MKLPPPLVALSPGTLAPDDAGAFLERVDAAVEAGLAAVLLREPALDDGPLLGLARSLRERLDGDRWLGVHDRVHVALACGADAAHLGFRSLTPADARAAAGEGLALGLSTHGNDDRASWDGASYLFHGPLRETPSKSVVPDPPPVTGTRGIAAVASDRAEPVLALGGVTAEDAAELRASGVAGVAVLGGVFGTGVRSRAPEEVAARVRALATAWESAG